MKHLVLFENFELVQEIDTSATGGVPTGGSMIGQPNGLAGQTISTNWASKTDVSGPNQLSVGYNPGGTNRMQQQIEMGKNHGPRTGKKSREKKLDMKALRASFKKRQETETDTEPKAPGEKKVMSFDDFEKSDVNTIKK